MSDYDSIASFVRGGYDAVSKMAFRDITLFEQHDGKWWSRADTRVRQQYYPPPRIESMVFEAGYTAVEYWKLTGSDDFSFGRAAFKATAP